MGVGIGLFIVVLLVVIVFIIANDIQIKGWVEKFEAIEVHLRRLEDFSATQRIIGVDATTGLAVDEQRNRVCLINRTEDNVTTRIYSYDDLLSCELFEDGVTLTKTVRSSQIGGALVGGLLLGGVGAVIGGLSGRTQTSGKVTKVDVRVTVNDTARPLHDITFLNGETEKHSDIYTHAIQEARQCHGLIEVLIKRADLEGKQTHAVTVSKRARIQFRVSGVHRDTGAECTVSVYAPDEAVAIRIANAQDILVGDIVMVAIEDMSD